MKIVPLADIQSELITHLHQEVWCNVATLDTKNRPRSRVLHPIWEVVDDQVIGWIATGRNSLKAKHLDHNPHISVSYAKDPFKPIYLECFTQWVDDPTEKQRIWDWFGTTPPPLGYDLAAFFGTVDHPEYGLLRLEPWRIELADLLGEARAWQKS